MGFKGAHIHLERGIRTYSRYVACLYDGVAILSSSWPTKGSPMSAFVRLVGIVLVWRRLGCFHLRAACPLCVPCSCCVRVHLRPTYIHTSGCMQRSPSAFSPKACIPENGIKLCMHGSNHWILCHESLTCVASHWVTEYRQIPPLG